MKIARAALVVLFGSAAPAAAADWDTLAARFGVEGYADFRLVMPSDQQSWIDRGLGKTRYGDPDQEPQFRLGSIFVPLALQTRGDFTATLPPMAKTSATPWGAATVVDELSLQQRAGDKRFASVVQLLDAGGERLVRFAYATAAHGFIRRGPVTMLVGDLERLREELAGHPELASAFGLNGPRRGLPGGRGRRRRASPG